MPDAAIGGRNRQCCTGVRWFLIKELHKANKQEGNDLIDVRDEIWALREKFHLTKKSNISFF